MQGKTRLRANRHSAIGTETSYLNLNWISQPSRTSSEADLTYIKAYREHVPAPISRPSSAADVYRRPGLVSEHLQEPIQSLRRLKDRALKGHEHRRVKSRANILQPRDAASSDDSILRDFVRGGKQVPSFEKSQPNARLAAQKHEMITFRQRFLALAGEVRNQIYDEILNMNMEVHNSMSGSQMEEDIFISFRGRPYGNYGASPRCFYYCNTEKSLKIHYMRPLPTKLHYIQKGDPIWVELHDRWCMDASLHIIDTISLQRRSEPHKSQDSLPPGSDSFKRLLSPSLVRSLSHCAVQQMRTCNLDLSIFNVDLNFADSTRHSSLTAMLLSKTVMQITEALLKPQKLTDLTITLTLWPGGPQDTTWHGYEPYFQSEEDIEALWVCLLPLKRVKGVKRIDVRRLHGAVRWMKRRCSLYPPNPPFVVVEPGDDDVEEERKCASSRKLW